MAKKKPNWYAGAAGSLLAGGITGLVVLAVYLMARQGPETGSVAPGDVPARPETAVETPTQRPQPSARGPAQPPATLAAASSPSKPPLPADLPAPRPEPVPIVIAESPPVSPLPLSTRPAKPPTTPKVEAPPPKPPAPAQTEPPPAPAPGPPPAAVRTAPEAPYVDQLIDPSVADQPLDAEAEEAKGLARYGPGAFGIEYRFFGSDASGDVDASIREHGLGIVMRQETLNFGRIDLQAAATNQSQDPGADQGSGDAIRLIQTDLPLSPSWTMDNLLGNVKATTPPLMASSYRLRLPAPFIEGLSSHVKRSDTTVAVTAGDLGVERGRTFLVFEETAGSIAGASAIRQFGPLWSAGLQIWDVKDAIVNGGTSSHTSVAGVAQYLDHVARHKGQLHFLRNDDGTLGVWLDGELNPGLWRHNFGVFRLEPDLLWINNLASVNNDQQGGYWTGTYRKFRTRLGFGVDVYENNLDDNPTLAGRKIFNWFANGSYQIDRRNNISGSAGLISQRQGAGLSTPDQDTRNLSTIFSRRFDIGSSFWTLGISDSDGDNDSTTRTEFLWDHEWTTRVADRLRTGIQYEQEDTGSDTLRQTSLRISAHRNFDNGRFGLNGDASFGVAGDGITDEGRTMSLNFSFDWLLTRALRLRLELNWNKNVAELVNGQEVRVSERSAFFSLRYDLGWGQRRGSLGRQQGQQGYGRISGTVFLDANRNGIQEPDEAGVPNVTIYMDRGFSVETDSQGRYEFWPVPTGNHALAVNLDNVPLPWGLDDESARRAAVTTRGRTELNYPLVKLNQ